VLFRPFFILKGEVFMWDLVLKARSLVFEIKESIFLGGIRVESKYIGNIRI